LNKLYIIDNQYVIGEKNTLYPTSPIIG